MFARLSRLFRAWMGFFITMAEDPEVMLQDEDPEDIDPEKAKVMKRHSPRRRE